jgi:hypothetical protein
MNAVPMVLGDGSGGRDVMTDKVKRVDDEGHRWTQAGVETAVRRIVAQLTPGGTPGALKRATTLEADLGWDKWYKLKVVKPVRKQLHEALEDNVVLYEVKTVGDLMDYVWARMDEVMAP